MCAAFANSHLAGLGRGCFAYAVRIRRCRWCFALAGDVENHGALDPSQIEGLPVGTCLRATFSQASRHRIATLFVPHLLSAPRRVFSFLDGQGYDCDLYFTDAADRSFKIVIPKTFDVGV